MGWFTKYELRTDNKQESKIRMSHDSLHEVAKTVNSWQEKSQDYFLFQDDDGIN